MDTDSLQKRYLAKLSANIIGLFVGVITQVIIPRGLGPVAYGNFHFLTDIFTKIIGFLDMGAATGFYTKLCQRQKEFGLVSFYLSFSFLVLLILLIFVGFVHLTGFYVTLFPDQQINFIYFGAIWGIMYWLVQIVNRIADAYGVTVHAEIAKIIQKVLGLVIISVLYFYDQLSLDYFFYYHYVILMILACSFIWVTERQGFTFVQSWKLTFSRIKVYFREFYSYCHPLFLTAVFALILGVLDRWMLQKFSGSAEQGFYGLSYQIGAICFLFSSAMTPLITREFSISFHKADLVAMARLFRRYVPMLYSIAAYFGCFIAVEASEVALIMGGEKFQNATSAIMIMALYPVHQTYGQLSGTIFYATGQTKLISKIRIIFFIIGLPLTYFLIAPTNVMGLNLGANGLAIKMVVLQFVIVNVQLYYNARFLSLRFSRYFIHQVGTLGVMLGLAFTSDLVVNSFFDHSGNIILRFGLTGFIYSLLVGGSTLVFPLIFGLNRHDIGRMKQVVLLKFSGLKRA
jgi:O-antigen/teichoic acid export membrane protein